MVVSVVFTRVNVPGLDAGEMFELFVTMKPEFFYDPYDPDDPGPIDADGSTRGSLGVVTGMLL